MEGARTALENLENSSSDRQLSFYRDMNLYVRNLVECLREKVREEAPVELWEERSRMDPLHMHPGGNVWLLGFICAVCRAGGGDQLAVAGHALSAV